MRGIQTREEKIAYYKKRMNDHVKHLLSEITTHKNAMVESCDRVNLDDREVILTFNQISQLLFNLSGKIIQLKEK